jgi:16S rRNA processing protein RimM
MEFLEIGRIIRPQGLKGRVKVLSYLDAPDGLAGVSEVSVGRRVEEAVSFPLEAMQPGHGAFIMKLKGIEDRDAAARFAGSFVWIPSDKMKPLPEGEYYWREIIGLAVVTEEGQSLGSITAVFPTGSNDVYVCQGAAGEILLPAIAEVIRNIDRDRGLLVVRLLKGLAAS